MADAPFELDLPDASATDALGAALARALLRVAGGGRTLYLHGELGAGKTTCVRSLLRTLGVEGTIKSPTYTLVESYHAAGGDCVHVDLYRLSSALEVEELDLGHPLSGNSLLVVEWPDRGGAALPPADLHVYLSYHQETTDQPASRRARAEAAGEVGSLWLSILRDDRSLSSYLSNLT